jgi:hypothetical protein
MNYLDINETQSLYEMKIFQLILSLNPNAYSIKCFVNIKINDLRRVE